MCGKTSIAALHALNAPGIHMRVGGVEHLYNFQRFVNLESRADAASAGGILERLCGWGFRAKEGVVCA